VKIDRVVVATAVSWLGLWVHELHRVPRLLGFTADGDLFMLPVAAGLAFWWSRSRGAPAAWALAIYAMVNLAGAVVTILPLGWLPFVPDQTVALRRPRHLGGMPAPAAYAGNHASTTSTRHKAPAHLIAG